MMLCKSSVLIAALAVGTVLAAPASERHVKEVRIEDLQCRCLTYRAHEGPWPCHFLESKGFGWRSGQMLVSQYDMSVQFASKSTIAKVLSIPAPLPNDVLETTRTGDAQSASVDANMSQNKIVCGFGREVRHMTHQHRHDEPRTHLVGHAIAWLTLFMILYAAAEYVWTR